VGRTRWLPALAGRSGGLVAVREIVGPQDHAAADPHPKGQPAESLACFPTTIDLSGDLPILRLERLAGLATLAAKAIDPAGPPLPCLVTVGSSAAASSSGYRSGR